MYVMLKVNYVLTVGGWKGRRMGGGASTAYSKSQYSSIASSLSTQRLFSEVLY